RVENHSFNPWGEKTAGLAPSQTLPETKGWIGERFDEDAGLQYLNARYYDPKLGLFLQPDWFEVTQAGVGTNRYSYSFNDPVNLLDPNGNVVPIAAIAIGAAIALLGSGDYANAPTSSSGWDGSDGGSDTYSRSSLDIASTMVGGAAARGILRAGLELARRAAAKYPRFTEAAATALAIDSMGEPGGGFGAGARVVVRQTARSGSNIGVNAPNTGSLLWGSWNDYPKVTIGSRDYAQIGGRNYPRHAVDRTQPSGLGTPAGADGPGRNVTPNMVEDVINGGSVRTTTVNGVPRAIYTSGNVSVVTEDAGRTIVTILRNRSP
ncbi:RHS repeat-associated core domain-containing protein, partial [Roseinatronobacter alkalisoli]